MFHFQLHEIEVPCTDSLCHAQPLLSERLSEADRHRQKRANVQAGQLQQKMSALMGRPLGEAELRTIFPSFSAQLPGSAFSGAVVSLTPSGF